MSVIRIEYALYDEIIEYARKHLPEEACGLIAGEENEEGKHIKKVYFLENTDHSSEHFNIDPKEQMGAIKDIRSKGYKLLGNWHSHPSSPSRPSEEDIKLAYDSGASYMILSLISDNPVMNAFHIEDGKWHKEDLRIYSEEYYF